MSDRDVRMTLARRAIRIATAQRTAIMKSRAISHASVSSERKASQRLIALLMAGSALTLPGVAMAQSWDGSASADYNTADNWNTNAAPTASGAVLINTLNNAPIIGSGQTGEGGTISVGEAGTGLLSITQGGALVLGRPGNGGVLSVGGSQTTNATGGNGTVRATGSGATISAPSSLALGVAITVNSAGLLEILDGAVMSTTSGVVGTAGGSNGTVTISGAGSRWDITSGAGGVRLGSTADDSARGTLNVLNGAMVTYPAGVGWTLGHGGSINVAGTGSLLQAPITVSSRGAISVTAGGEAEFSSISMGGTTQPATLSVSGAGSRLTFDSLGISGTQPNTISVSAGGAFVKTNVSSSGISIPNGSSMLVTGQGSTLDAAATISLSGSLTVADRAVATVSTLSQSGGTFALTGGAQFIQTSASSSSFAEQAAVLISGAGTVFTTAGNIAINSNNPNAADFVIADGAQVNINSISTSGLGFGGQRRLIVRDGSVLNITAGLTLNSGVIEATNATVNFGAANVQMGTLFNGNVITLVNSAFTADRITSGNDLNVINLGGIASGPAGGVGAFNVRLVNLAVGAEFVLNHTATDYVIGSNFAGTGIIRHMSGDTILTGNQTGASFSGQTLLTGGTLTINGTHGLSTHRLNASGGATLGGSGQINGTVTIADATLAPGNSPGTLTIGSDLVLGANALVSFELGAPDGVVGVASDLVNVNGNLTLDGRLDVIDAGGFGAGLYRLFNYGGTLTDNGLDLGTLPTGYAISDMSIQTAQANQVNLIVSAPTVPTSFTFWDGGDVDGNGFIDGGNGTWTVADSNWTTSDGGSNGAFRPEDFLIFSAATEAPQARFALAAAVVAPSSSAGTVTVDDTAGVVTLANGVQFATDGYTVTGDAIELAATIPCGECTPLPGSVIMRVGDGSSAGADFVATIQSQLTGAAGLEKTDLGTLILQGANTYAGGTRISDGVLQIAADNALGAAEGAVTFNGGTLRITAAMTSARGISVENGGGTLDSGANAITLSGTIGGTGNLTLNGSGLRTISDDSSEFAGSTTLTAGTLALPGSLGGLLTVDAPATLTGAGTSGSLDLSGTISPGATNGSTGTFNVSGDVTIRAGSTLNVDVAASGAGDRISAGGHALIEGGTVAVTALDPAQSYTNGTVYRIVNASGGLTGTFTGLTETSAFLDFALGYDPTGAFLTTTVTAQFPDVARTFNQRQASGALKNFETTAGSDALNVYNAILVQDADHARAAFDAASGEIYPTLLASRQRAGLELVERITMRGRADGNEGLAMWGGVLGDRGHVDSDGNGARSTANSFGWESGLDYRGPDNRWAVGFGGGWQEGDVTLTARGSSAKTDAWHIGGYVRYGSGAKGFSAMAGAVHADANASVTRQIGFGTIARTASSRVDLRTTAANLELRYGLGSAKLAVGPVVSIDHASTKLGRVAETGAAALNLTGTGKRESWTRYGVGGFARYDLGKGFADLSLRYVSRDRGDTEVNLTMAGSPTSYAVRAAGGSRGAARLDASTELSIGRRWTISGNLGAILAQSEGQVDGSIRLSYRF